jgi:TBC1 domain family protein 5
MFNPLAPVQNPSKQQLRDRETKELIKQDVIRTCQEFSYFRLQTTKDLLTQVLYLWAAEHDLGYKQGMNELLAIVALVFDTERQVGV